MKKRLFNAGAFLLFIFLADTPIRAQNMTEFQQNFQWNILSTKDSIHLDGILSENVWKSTPKATHFKKKYPSDIGEAKHQTEVMMIYDEKNIYFAFKVYDSGGFVTKSLKRDIGQEGNDGIGVILDPANQKSNGFFFVLSALNVQSEDQLTSDYDEKPSWSWDTKWFSATKDYGSYWIAEIMIPLKSLRYDPKQKDWGINFVRTDAKSVEYSAWTKIPPNFKSYDLGYTGILHWPDAPPMTNNNLILLPYATGSLMDEKENNLPLKATGNAGFDAKVALNSSLNLDLTVNPDFSQVEVDRQVTNLTRYNIFLPERRNFFLENSDLFANFGIPIIRPFYSRTIGLDKEGNRIPILFGARLSGNLTPSTRIGAMNMQTGRQGNYAPENFSAFTLQRRVLKRSVLKGYVLNRENFLSEEEEKKNPLDRYGRNTGIDFNYSNPSGSFSSWSSLHHSFKPGIKDLNTYFDGGLGYDTRTFNALIDITNIGKNYYTDLGFVQRINNYDALRDTNIRVGFKHVYTDLGWKILPSAGKIGRYQLNLKNYFVLNPDNSFNENSASLELKIDYRNASYFECKIENNLIQLLYPINFTGGKPLPSARYQYNQFSISYMSDIRKLFSWSSGFSFGEFYNGHIRSLETGFNWRNQPNFSLALKTELNQVNLPGEYGKTTLFLIAPRIEYNFNTQLFWTTFVQYNSQSNNFNVNSRIQYRYKPMSDFFLVYTDNYFTDPLFKNKNRALIFKFSYWFNI